VKNILPKEIQAHLERFSATDRDLINRAFLYAHEKHDGQKRRSGEDYITHPYHIALSLAKDKYDAETIAAGFLHDTVEDTSATTEEVAKLFGKNVANIVDGVTKVSTLKIRDKEKIFSNHQFYMEQVDNYRKILFASISDLRVMIVKLYDRLDNVQTLDFISENKRKFYARETIEIFSAIADRLGIGSVKSRLEDFAFPYAYPEEFAKFGKEIEGIYRNPQETIKRIIPEVKKALAEANIDFINLSGRAKGLYSLYRKIERKGSIKLIYDISALRIIVNTVEECYKALGVIHTLYEPVPGQIHDYIAKPKQNGYQSVHTSVKDSTGNIFEVQIRTAKMHENSEHGLIASHWQYKESAHKNAMKGQEQEWAKELSKLQELSSAKDFMSGLKEQLFDQQIFLFTPKGDILKMPIGSTPIDFAYRIHSDLGDHCVGARVNGRIVPINSALHTSDFVEVITNKASFPSRDWLRFIKTTQAKQHIRGYLREKEAGSLAIAGEEKLAAAITKYNLTPLNKNEAEALLEDSRLPYNKLEGALISVGEGSLQITRLLKVIYPNFKTPETRAPRAVKKTEAAGISILAGIRHDFAKCCKPKDGDPIVGYLGREHVIKVHRANCKRLTNLDKNRFIKLT